MSLEKANKIGTILGTIFGTILAIGILIGIGYLGFILLKGVFEPRPWKGMFFPDASNPGYTSVTKDFKTLDECRTWAINEAEDSSISSGDWTYECGKNCKLDSKNSLGNINTYDCEQIRK